MNQLIIEKLDELKSLIQNNLRDRWLNINEVSKYAGVSTSTIMRAVAKAELKISRKTGRNLFRISWVDAWLNG